jgi:solute carrier family 35 (adenosine 3'-phospho 5'-phosphosulfate transporter), member B2
MPQASRISEILHFIAVVGALQCSYLIWGVMQETIMNSTFIPTPSSPSGKFPSATFCVFSNRVVAVIVAWIACKRVHGTVKSQSPFLNFTPCSLSNTISSWAQYQALVYVPFSLQTLFKSTKVIPVMIMGTFLKGTKYSYIEYIEASMITLGVGIFSTYKVSKKGHTQLLDVDNDNNYETLGFICLCIYILCDSFTSQWQSKLYSQFGEIDHWHMMFGINISSVVFTLVAMIIQGEIPIVLEFLIYNPSTIYYNIATSITSATGQIAIYYCIRKYGPTIFTIIMTTRQVFSILLSNLLFQHPLSNGSAFGAFLVFSVVFYSSYRRFNQNKTNTDVAPISIKKNDKDKDDNIELLQSQQSLLLSDVENPNRN